MKIRQYLIEEDIDFSVIVHTIKRDCKPAISFYKNAKNPLYRGLANDTKDNFIKKTARTDRQPRVIGEPLHDLLDKCFMKHFGWKARSEGVFTGSKDIANSWGKMYTVFPIGKFEYIYTVDPLDNFWKILVEYRRYKTFTQAEVDMICSRVKGEYRNKGLENIIKNGNTDFEAILRCKEYYAVLSSKEMFDYIMENV